MLWIQHGRFLQSFAARFSLNELWLTQRQSINWCSVLFLELNVVGVLLVFFPLHSPTAKQGTARYHPYGWIPESVSVKVCLRGESQIFQLQNMPTLSQKVWFQLEPSLGTCINMVLSSRLRVHICSQSLISYKPLWTRCSCRLCCLSVLELAIWKLLELCSCHPLQHRCACLEFWRSYINWSADPLMSGSGNSSCLHC